MLGYRAGLSCWVIGAQALEAVGRGGADCCGQTDSCIGKSLSAREAQRLPSLIERSYRETLSTTAADGHDRDVVVLRSAISVLADIRK